jgi:hypothetical protein
LVDAKQDLAMTFEPSEGHWKGYKPGDVMMRWLPYQTMPTIGQLYCFPNCSNLIVTKHVLGNIVCLQSYGKMKNRMIVKPKVVRTCWHEYVEGVGMHTYVPVVLQTVE